MALKGFFEKASRKLGFIPEADRSHSIPWIVDHEKPVWTGYTTDDGMGITDAILYQVLKKSPEIVGVIRVLVHDILADGWTFTGSDSDVANATEKQEELYFLKVMNDALWDLFVTGDAYILKLAVDPLQVKSKLPLSPTKGITDMEIKQIPSMTKGLQVLKSCTVRIRTDEFGEISEYHQRVGEKERSFKPTDVIHLSFENIGGSVYGFTPTQPLLSDIANLINGKEYLGKVFEEVNPPIIYNLPEESGGEESRNYQLLKKQLNELKKKQNKLKSIIVTGTLTTKSVEPFAPQDQIAAIIKHFTSIIMFAWGVPPHRVSFLQEKVSQTPKESDNGYYKSIDFMQDILQLQINNQLWKEFNVKMRFNKSYRIDELQQATVSSIMMDRNAITVEEARARVGFDPEIPEGTLPIKLQQQKFSFYNENTTGAETENTTPPELQDNKVKP